MTNGRNQQGGIAYAPVKVYLANAAVPFGLYKLDMSGLASFFPMKSSAAALGLHCVKKLPIIGSWARLGLGAVALYNGVDALNDFNAGQYIDVLFKGMVVYTAGMDALRND